MVHRPGPSRFAGCPSLTQLPGPLLSGISSGPGTGRDGLMNLHLTVPMALRPSKAIKRRNAPWPSIPRRPATRTSVSCAWEHPEKNTA